MLEYTGSAVLLAGLCYFGFFYTVDADYMTLLGAANSHAQGAQRIPPDARGIDGQLLREELLDQAEDLVNRAEAFAPGIAQAVEVLAFITSLRGDHLAAADLYAKARTLESCGREMRDDLVLNQVRALLEAKRPDLALKVLDAESADLLSQNGTIARRLNARALQQSGRIGAARSLAIEIQDADGEGGTDSLYAGVLLEELGDLPAAEAAFKKAATTEPVANYFLARLKVRNGQPDRGVEMLERAVSDARRETLRFLRRDRELWNRHVDAERLRRLIEPSGKAATPGR